VGRGAGAITGVINAGNSDLFEYSGNSATRRSTSSSPEPGSTHDTIQFAANDFGSFAAVQSAMSQVGSDVLIRLDATDSITLAGVTLANLVAADFKFV
jgi:trimeric autotransporter adhesin